MMGSSLRELAHAAVPTGIRLNSLSCVFTQEIQKIPFHTGKYFSSIKKDNARVLTWDLRAKQAMIGPSLRELAHVAVPAGIELNSLSCVFTQEIEKMPFHTGRYFARIKKAILEFWPESKASDDGSLFTRICSCCCPCRDNIKWPQLCCYDYHVYIVKANHRIVVVVVE